MFVCVAVRQRLTEAVFTSTLLAVARVNGDCLQKNQRGLRMVVLYLQLGASDSNINVPIYVHISLPPVTCHLDVASFEVLSKTVTVCFFRATGSSFTVLMESPC